MRTNKEKVEMYENLLHRIQMYYGVVDSKKVKNLLDNISSWSYTHRSGNGMLSDEEQQERIDNAFDNLLEIKE